MTRRPLLLAFCLAGGFARAPSQQGESRGPISLDDPASRSAVVARVGSIGITAQEFLLNYEFAPSFVKQRKDAKKHLLNLMINEKLFALEAENAASEARIASALEEIEGDLATEELYKRDILPRVRVTPAALARGVREAAYHLQVQWLVVPDSASLGALTAALRRGTRFDSLFIAQNPDSASRLNHTMDGTLFDIRRRNGPVGAALAGLSPRTVSPAVRGSDGWYYLRIRDAWSSALQTETEQMKIRHDVEEALKQQSADSVSDRYVVALMTANRPLIVKEPFALLLAFLAQHFIDSATAASWGYLPPEGVRGAGARGDSRWIEPWSARPLVTLRGGRDTLRLGTFLSWYRNRETLIKLPAHSKVEFFYEAEQLVWRMVRDRLLVERARQRKLTTIQAVRVQKSWWEEKLLFEAAKSGLVNQIPWREEDLRTYFNGHRRDFRDANGDTLGFEAARDDVLRSYFSVETTKRMYHRVVVLRRKYPVEVRDAVLARIPVEQGQAKPIDVYTVKKGGTFPRPAFPTVDPGWREWY